MIGVDTNVLVYAHRREPRRHREAAEVLKGLAEGRNPWAVPWPCVYEFFSVVTNPRIWKGSESTPDEAWHQVEVWAAAPTVSLLAETEGFLEILESFALRPRVRGPIVHDARVAAICVAHGVEEFLTADRDFTLFPELKCRNPLGSR